ncbi:MAG: ADP-ribosylglycohydrolase family protein, partial [Clostridiales bacterium]|nr:ADP-ribosylglycohydrolase family protein [Clostridiales bacterium]
MSVSLREKFFGCIAGAHIGSAMGAVVEGWSYEKIEEKYGTFDQLLPYEHYNNGWVREAGTTEDGIERQKLMITAIIEKGNRVNAEDVRKAWIDHIKPESAGMVSEPFEATLLAMAKSGIPARDLGRYCDYSGLNSFARSCHPDIVLKELDKQLKHTKECKDFRELRKAFDSEYNGYGMPYA